jgi:serine/threonine protein kinase
MIGLFYLLRNQYGQTEHIAKILGIVTITDFGLAVEGVGPHDGPIQAEPLRAPEVMLDAGWSYSSDMWNFGIMV